jgi:hypothetical protein
LCVFVEVFIYFLSYKIWWKATFIPKPSFPLREVARRAKNSESLFLTSREELKCEKIDHFGIYTSTEVHALVPIRPSFN